MHILILSILFEIPEQQNITIFIKTIYIYKTVNNFLCMLLVSKSFGTFAINAVNCKLQNFKDKNF